MNKIVIRVTGFLLCISILLSACQADAPEEQPVVLEELPHTCIITEGHIEPEKSSELSFGISGLVEEILIKEGDSVHSGDVIVRLASCAGIEGEIKTAQFKHLQVQQALDDLALHADVEREKAQQSVLDAQELFHTAQKEWDDYNIDNYEENLGKAQEDVQNAESDLEEASADLKDFLDLDENNSTRKSYQDKVDEAERNLHKSQKKLNDIKSDYMQVKLNFDLAASQLTAAEEEYNNKKDGPDVDQLSLLQAQSDALKQQIEGLKSTLNNCQIKSPIDGILMKNDLQKDEFTPAGKPVVMVADPSHWIIKTDDLSEYDVVQIYEGQSVEIQVDALQEENLPGIVDSIDCVSLLDYGDVTYPVTISIMKDVDGLRWGMSARVLFKEDT
ncbi:MAG: HlyD family efflux transporter periplasmic adaptor subunit [Anaerolineaceae bacterium]|nr:HlyD family efflux transporter periplasmic adaptor subunit [Anaerolineaceae bacterium]